MGLEWLHAMLNKTTTCVTPIDQLSSHYLLASSNLLLICFGGIFFIVMLPQVLFQLLHRVELLVAYMTFRFYAHISRRRKYGVDPIGPFVLITCGNPKRVITLGYFHILLYRHHCRH